jgi:tRNA (guanine37-N1)-methyltransferase
MKFDIISIFPEVFYQYSNTSILKRAQEKGVASFVFHNLRDYTTDPHKSVDDTPYGGGAGMVMKVEPIYRAVKKIKDETIRTRIILFSAKGKQFTQEDAQRLTHYDQIVGICGRYEGVDERVAEYIADEEISIGPYVLTGGELPALIVCDAVTRLLPGVLGNPDSLEGESHGQKYHQTYPQYTRPEVFHSWIVPHTLLEGNHAEIEKWRSQNTKTKKT